MEKVKIGLITVNYNGEKEVISCLQSLYQLRLKHILLHIYIIDNSSEVESGASIEKHLHECKSNDITTQLIRSHVNEGFTGGNNFGIAHALKDGCTSVVLLNNDTIVHPDLLEELLAASRRYPQAGILVPKIYFAPGFEFHKQRYSPKEVGKVLWYAGGEMDWNNVIGHHRGVDEVDSGQYDKEGTTELATGCCMFLPSLAVQNVGVFDNRYFMYYEDADLSMRMKKNDYVVYYVPKGVLWHKNAASSGGSGSALQDYYTSRNRMLFGMEYAPWRAKIALTRESFRLMKMGRTWQRKGIIDYYKKKFGKGSYAKTKVI